MKTISHAFGGLLMAMLFVDPMLVQAQIEGCDIEAAEQVCGPWDSSPAANTCILDVCLGGPSEECDIEVAQEVCGGNFECIMDFCFSGGSECLPPCGPGFTCLAGECVLDTGPVCSPSCQNGGDCVFGNCVCLLGFSGPSCEIAVPTEPVCIPVCENGGECIDDGVCSCLPGFSGDRCETQIGFDHFMFYKSKSTKDAAKFVRFGPVQLSDQFGSDQYDVQKPKQLGLPSNKNDEGVADAITHLAEYQVKAIRGTPEFETKTGVRIFNQCNDDVLLEVKKPKSVLVPTLKDHDNPVQAPDAEGHNLDHFLCYQAKVQKKRSDGTLLPKLPKGTQVEVLDQFHSQKQRYDLKKITKLCNPTAKSGSPVFLSGPDTNNPAPLEPATIRNPTNHLVCYKAKLAKKNIPQAGCGCDTTQDERCVGANLDPMPEKHAKLTGLYINNQFGPLELDTIKEGEFCIPSLKSLQ